MSEPDEPAKPPKLLEQLKEVKSEAAELRNFAITFLSLLLYVNLIIAGTTPEQILRVAPVMLPLLNVPLPIIGFYGFLPWLLLFFHLYLLVQHYLFSRELFHFRQALDAAEDPTTQNYVRKNLGNLPFLHWMMNCHGPAMALVLTLITLICLIIWPLVTLLWLQMAILPYHDYLLLWWQRAAIMLDVLLVGWLWPKTLGADDSNAEPMAWTWWKPILGGLVWLVFHPLVWLGLVAWLGTRTLALDSANVLAWNNKWQDFLFFSVALALWLIFNLLVFKSGFKRYKQDMLKFFPPVALAGLLSAVLFLSLLVAVFPDSPEEKLIIGDLNSNPVRIKTYQNNTPFWLAPVDADYSTDHFTRYYSRYAFAPIAWLHENHAKLLDKQNDIDSAYAKGAKDCPMSAPDKTANAASAPTKPSKTCLLVPPWLPRNLVLREKVLTADTTLKPEQEAQLQWNAKEDNGPKFAAAITMNGVDWKGEAKQAQPGSLDQIRGLDLQNRNFDYADFSKSSLPKADLRYASLKHAAFRGARLDQAQMISAHLDQADLVGAKLPGVTLSFAELPGAVLSGAELPGAVLSGAKLPGADLSFAELPGAVLSKAKLSGADLSGAELPGAVLSFAELPGAILSRAKLPGASLFVAKLPGAVLQINAFPLSAEYKTHTVEQYRQALTLRPEYQGQTHQTQKLEGYVKAFKNQIEKPPNFTQALSLKPCLRDDASEKLLPDCFFRQALDEAGRKDFADNWLALACQDKTEGHWLARRMVERAEKEAFKWFRQPLQDKAKDPSCKGLEGLPEEYQARLQDLKP
jgi:uncharacterized protein YjbI with pentapeptide repeats